MDTAELDRFAATLRLAIADARVFAMADPTIGEEVREAIRHAREIHDLFVEAPLRNESLQTEEYRGLADLTGNAVDELEAFVARADGRIN